MKFWLMDERAEAAALLAQLQDKLPNSPLLYIMKGWQVRYAVVPPFLLALLFSAGCYPRSLGPAFGGDGVLNMIRIRQFPV